MKAFTYFYKVYLQKWRDGYVGLRYRGYPVEPKDAISSQICVWGEGDKWKKLYFNSYRIAPQLAIGNRIQDGFGSSYDSLTRMDTYETKVYLQEK